MGCSHEYNTGSPAPIAVSTTVSYVAEDTPEYEARAPVVRRQGEVLRLAMALIEGARITSNDRKQARSRLKRFCAKSVGKDVTQSSVVCADEELGAHLMELARQSDRQLSEQLELLVRFADAELYKQEGCRTMVQWMDVNLGIGRIAASEHLRVGRALRELPMCGALFALGKLSYTKARSITRHAREETDEAFATATLDLSTSETDAWCEQFRHEQDADAIAAAEDSDAQAALIAHERRALRTRDISAHSTRITLDLPKDMAAEFLKSLEQCDNEVLEQVRDEVRDAGASAYGPEQDSPSPVQRRADAAVLMSRRSLSYAGEAVSMADRFRVHVTIDSATLAGVVEDASHVAKAKPKMDGNTPISPATVRRLAEVAGFTAYAMDEEGDPVASKKVAAPFTRRQLRALRARDGCCQMPGCRATQHLDGHHVVPRAEGGQSTFDNAVLLCGGCHRLLHEGDFRLKREPANVKNAPAGCVRRYRLFGADGTEYGSRGAALRLAATARGSTDFVSAGKVLQENSNPKADTAAETVNANTA